MGRYLTALETTTRFKASDSGRILAAFQEVAESYPTNYGWRQTVLDATSLKEIADEFNIQLYHTDTPAGCIIPILSDTYLSDLFIDILPKIAPYMANGKIAGLDSEGGDFSITFKNGKATRKGR